MKMDISAVPDVDLSGSIAALRKYQARKRLKKAINAVRATVRTRMLFAAKAAKVAMAAGAGEEEVQNVFFEAAKRATSARQVAPPLPAVVLPSTTAMGHQQFRVSAIVSPAAAELRASTGTGAGTAVGGGPVNGGLPAVQAPGGARF